jgi:quercetin dioxygenase-like cupin family protein
MNSMKIINFDRVERKDVGEGASKVKVRWLINEEMGANNFFMRLFEIEVGGYTPLHVHDWEHEVFILEGEGIVICEDEVKIFRTGDAVFIAPDEKHQFRNVGKSLVKLLCLIPNKKGSLQRISCGCK